jgi:hypothetical protein
MPVQEEYADPALPPPTPGGFVEITYGAVGKKRGTFVIPARMTTDQTVGITTERVTLTVT